MGLNPYINFDGNAKEAIDFYIEVFSLGEPAVMLFKDMPPDPANPFAEEDLQKVMHATLTIGGTILMMSDTIGVARQAYVKGNNMALSYTSDSLDALEDIYERLAAGGHVLMPFGETFFSKGYGFLVDRFGISWHLSHMA